MQPGSSLRNQHHLAVPKRTEGARGLQQRVLGVEAGCLLLHWKKQQLWTDQLLETFQAHLPGCLQLPNG